MSVGVLDYGVGNTGSILSMFRKLAIPAAAVSDPSELARHERFVLPGVGAFDTGMRRLREGGFVEPLEQLVLAEQRPILGICLGMQMLADRSEEGDGEEPGLGWIHGEVRRMRPFLPADQRLPFMGWAYVEPTRDSPLFPPTDEPQRFYFVHSLSFHAADEGDVLAVVDHGAPVCAAVGRGNVVGTQFHPEKSHRFGMELLRSFAAIGADEDS